MANTIKIKNSTVSNNAPSSLEYGELAINAADEKLFYKNTSNEIKSVNLQTVGASGLLNVVEDETPQLGGDLDGQGNNITDIGALTADTIQLIGGEGTQGTLSWNIDDETLDLIRNGSTLQLGQEVQIHCTKHGSVANIPDGVPVIAMGTTGGSSKILIGEATLSNWQIIDSGATEIPAKQVIGVSTEAITNNGSVTCFGKVNDVAGANYTAGSIYYVNQSGGLTSTKPTSGLVMPIAFAINSDTLMVRTTPINELMIEEAYSLRHNHSNKSILDATTASYTTAEQTKLAGIEAGATGDMTASEILTLIKTVDGSGSGLDADLLDGHDSSYYQNTAIVEW